MKSDLCQKQHKSIGLHFTVKLLKPRIFVKSVGAPSCEKPKTIPRQLILLCVCYEHVANPDPGSGAFFTPGSQIPNHILESLMTIFWVKSSIIQCKLTQVFFLHQFKNKISLSSAIFVATKKGTVGHQIFPLLFCCCFCIRDPGWIIIRIQDKNPDPQHRL